MNRESESFLTSEEREREREYFQLIYDLGVKNRSRYEEQAERLLGSGELSITLNDSLLLYTLEDGGCSLRVSKDGGSDFYKLGWTRLKWRRREKLKTLIDEFAYGEARIISNR